MTILDHFSNISVISWLWGKISVGFSGSSQELKHYTMLLPFCFMLQPLYFQLSTTLQMRTLSQPNEPKYVEH